MIYVTNDAMEELERLLTASDKISGDSFRIVEKAGGMLALVNDTMNPEDQKVEHDGKVLVVAGPGLTSDYKNISIDSYKTSEGSRLVISEEDKNMTSSTITVNWVPLS